MSNMLSFFWLSGKSKSVEEYEFGSNWLTRRVSSGEKRLQVVRDDGGSSFVRESEERLDSVICNSTSISFPLRGTTGLTRSDTRGTSSSESESRNCRSDCERDSRGIKESAYWKIERASR